MNENSDATQDSGGPSSTGLPSPIAGALCYSLGFITGFVFLILEKDSRLIRFHAMQSTILFGALFVLYWVLVWIPIPPIGPVIALLYAPVSVTLWIVLMVTALIGVRLKLPIVGDIALSQL